MGVQGRLLVSYQYLMSKFLQTGLFLVVFLISQQNIAQTSWTGTKNTNWNNSLNWTNGVPLTGIDAIIGDGSFTGPNDPTVNISASCNSLTIGNVNVPVLTLKKNLVVNGNITIQNGATISHPASTLTVKGNWISDGTYTTTSNSAKLVFGGSAQLISGSVLTTFRQVTVNTGSVVTLGTNTSVSGSGSYIDIYGTLNPGQLPTYKLTSTVNFRVYNSGTIKVNADQFANHYTLSGSVTLNYRNIVDYSATITNQIISSAYTYSTLMWCIAGGTNYIYSESKSLSRLWFNDTGRTIANGFDQGLASTFNQNI